MSDRIPERIPGGGVDLSHLAASGGNAHPGNPATSTGTSAAAGAALSVASLVVDVTDASFEQIAQLSAQVPVVFDLWAEWCQPCKSLSPIIEKVTRDLDGRVLLAKVDVDANPGLAQAFQAQSIPTVVALVGGRPVPLFQGALPEPEVRQYFDQLLQLAAQYGVTGRAHVDGSDPVDEPTEPEIPEAHRAAVEAAERGDYDAAVHEWEAVLLKAPADAVAREALVQVKLLARLNGHSADEIRAAAAQNPASVDAQLAVADLDIAGGHVEDGFLRLLELYAKQSGDDDRTAIRERLLELFEVVGVADPRVIAARRQLASLLY